MKTNEALRVVGYLLEAHPTTGVLARTPRGLNVHADAPDACSWCLLGAVIAVETRVRRRPWMKGSPLLLGVQRLLGRGLAQRWDEGSDQERARIIAKLKGVSA